MCTLTVLKTPDGFRVFMNRDEALDRAPELPPAMLDADHGIVAPQDPQGGGTWIAHNGKGYWGCLLNGYAEQHPVVTAEGYTSRGVILPTLLAAENPFDAVAALQPERFLSFRLVIGSATEIALYCWDGVTLSRQPFAEEITGQAWFLTSSSWNQQAVIDSRSALFRSWMARQAVPFVATTGLPSYHLSSEPTLAMGPFMSRSNARTKSITELTIGAAGAKMDYQVIAPWQLAAKAEHEIAV